MGTHTRRLNNCIHWNPTYPLGLYTEKLLIRSLGEGLVVNNSSLFVAGSPSVPIFRNKIDYYHRKQVKLAHECNKSYLFIYR